MRRQIIAIFFLFIFLSLTGFLIYSALKPEKLPIGAAMPELSYLTKTGAAELRVDAAETTMLVYFHRTCEYCRYQLNMLNNNLPQFTGMRIILLTPENDFFTTAAGKIAAWPSLLESPSVSWGIVDKEEFVDKFGAKGFPTTYIFGKDGALAAKIFGEVKLAKLLTEIKKVWRSGTPG